MSCFSLFYSTELFQYRNFLIFDIKKVFLSLPSVCFFFLRNNNNTHTFVGGSGGPIPAQWPCRSFCPALCIQHSGFH